MHAQAKTAFYRVVLMVYQVNKTNAAYIIRAASLAAGIPNTSGAYVVNRFCSSGLKAVEDIANEIREGSIEVGIAIGAEFMTGGAEAVEPFHEEIMKNQESADCLQPMGQTSENVGADFSIARELQDRYAQESFARAEAAQKAGLFDDEIVPITTKAKDPKTGEEKVVTLTRDEGVRYGTTYEGLSKIRPAFPQFGDKTTGGNASQLTDGGSYPLLYNVRFVVANECSRCNPLNEAIQSCGAQPAHPRQVLRRNRGRRSATNHGNRALGRNPKAPKAVWSRKDRH